MFKCSALDELLMLRSFIPQVGSVSKIVLSGLGYNTPKPKETQKDTQEEKERAKIIAEMRNDDAKFHDQAEAEVSPACVSCLPLPTSVSSVNLTLVPSLRSF